VSIEQCCSTKPRRILFSLPAAADANLVPQLRHLSVNVKGTGCLQRTNALLRNVFDQLDHFSLKTKCRSLPLGDDVPLLSTISGYIIQEQCLDRLRVSATYELNLLVSAKGDREHRTTLESFARARFFTESGRDGRPSVVIREYPIDPDDTDHEIPISILYLRFRVYTLPFCRRHFYSVDLPDEQ
jgi:hypothetical protein